MALAFPLSVSPRFLPHTAAPLVPLSLLAAHARMLAVVVNLLLGGVGEPDRERRHQRT
jgi:hypothetical protein